MPAAAAPASSSGPAGSAGPAGPAGPEIGGAMGPVGRVFHHPVRREDHLDVRRVEKFHVYLGNVGTCKWKLKFVGWIVATDERHEPGPWEAERPRASIEAILVSLRTLGHFLHSALLGSASGAALEQVGVVQNQNGWEVWRRAQQVRSSVARRNCFNEIPTLRSRNSTGTGSEPCWRSEISQQIRSPVGRRS